MQEHIYAPDCDIFIIKLGRIYILRRIQPFGPDILFLNQNTIKKNKKRRQASVLFCCLWTPYSLGSFQQFFAKLWTFVWFEFINCEILSFSQITDNSGSPSKKLQKRNVILEAQRRKLINLHSTVIFIFEGTVMLNCFNFTWYIML